MGSCTGEIPPMARGGKHASVLGRLKIQQRCRVVEDRSRVERGCRRVPKNRHALKSRPPRVVRPITLIVFDGTDHVAHDHAKFRTGKSFAPIYKELWFPALLDRPLEKRDTAWRKRRDCGSS